MTARQLIIEAFAGIACLIFFGGLCLAFMAVRQ